MPTTAKPPTLRTCPFCKKTGKCGKCNGAGNRVSLKRGRFNKKVRQEMRCSACDGTGSCPLCSGAGTLQNNNDVPIGQD